MFVQVVPTVQQIELPALPVALGVDGRQGRAGRYGYSTNGDHELLKLAQVRVHVYSNQAERLISFNKSLRYKSFI